MAESGSRDFGPLAKAILTMIAVYAVGVAANVIYQRRKKSGGITFDIISVRE